MTNYRIMLVDDHESVLSGTLHHLQDHYSQANFCTTKTVESTLEEIEKSPPDLVITDLSMPYASSDTAIPENGIKLLQQLFQAYPTLNIVVHTTYPQALIRLRPEISNHGGGFTIASKEISIQELLKRVDWALQGIIYTPQEMRSALEVKPEWLDVLTLAFQEGLQDKAIAESMHISERTVRNYWSRVQDALGVYPEEGKNIRIQTEIQARKKGLID